MKRQRIVFLLTLLMSMVGANSFAHDIEVKNSDGVTIYYLYNGDGTLAVSYRGTSDSNYSNEYSGNVVIPASVNYRGVTYSVTSIGNRAFFDCRGLTSVTIPSSVTSIGDWAFCGCSGLTSVTIPSSVTSIGVQAFSYCSGLTSAHISDLVAWCKISFRGSDSNPLWYAHSLYLNGKEVKDLVIPSGVTSIGAFAFLRCSGLTSLTIPSSVTSIDDWAFSGCSGLTSIKVEADNSKYDSRDNCNAIIETQSNTLILGCKSTIIPSSVTSIGNSAFEGCSGLTTVSIPSGVTSIGGDAFQSCSGLTSVTIPSSVTSIGGWAFSYCDGLTSVTIPSSVTSIGNDAFYGCNSLTSVTAMMKTPVSINDETFSNRKNAMLYVPYGCKATYETADYWKEFKEIVELEKVAEYTDISQLADAIYIEPTEARCGSQTTLSVKMKNDVPIQTIQFDLYLPDGITIVPNEDDELVTESKERINRFNYFESSMQADGALRLLAQATSTNVPAGDGEICRIVVDIPESMEEGDYPLIIKGALMVEKNNTSHSPDPNLVQTKLTVLKYVLGDASNDGDVNAIDFNMIGNHILGQTQEGFNVKAADISGDGDVNAIDFNMVGNMILNGSTASAREGRTETTQDPD